MKLGSIVGIVFSCLLIIAGIVLCVVGNETAKDSDQLLFTQRSDGGTYYCEKIDKGTNRVKIQFDKADITVIGGAEKSQIRATVMTSNAEQKMQIDSVQDATGLSDSQLIALLEKTTLASAYANHINETNPDLINPTDATYMTKFNTNF